MTPLYDPERHVALPSTPWDPAHVRGWLIRWADETLEIWAREQHWPWHPRDVEDTEPEAGPPACLYLGASGVWLALARVAEAGLCRLPVDLPDIFARLLADYVGRPDTGERVPSWFLGESFLLVM